jgi:hypothetical protein
MIKAIVTRFAVGLAFVATSSAHAGFIYEVSDGTTTTQISPIANSQTAAGYYDLFSASGHPAFGAENNKAFFWLYEDTGTNVLSLGMIFDMEDPGNTGSGNITLTTSGFPTGAAVAVSDDGSETATLINGTERFSWNAANTDGAMISGLEATEWTIDLAIDSFAGLGNGFFFVDGPATTGSADIPLAIAAGDTITISAREMGKVPAPGTLALLAAGLLATAYRRR